ncbi:3-oxo-tetronate kinase [Paenirhodobacter populi]|uniref:3-oxo-tetronate kinase n=1 Tax=Paenirhodobacter populi TaxID=2306993 RepID=UPI000FE42DB6|nr:3-oxo-tetronate kinase [Sinirhodobacter populi]RWR04672.1 four-carbon acid sugar kinase family protein [Sinirhodobacter populi]
MLLGVIADDFTGATDIAGFLQGNGLRTLQLNGVPAADLSVDADAVVISLKSRSCPPEEAVADSLAALDWLRARDCAQFFFKYCSTFDSTAKGNIGPVTDALLDALDEDFTVICPVLPVNGRTIYNGYLFVNDVPLNESGMRNHPVTPMTDANIMRVMEAQSRGRAGNVPSRIMDQGVEAVRAALNALKAGGMRYAVLDALNDRHLEVMGAAVQGMKLVTGGSGLADGMARHWTTGRIDEAGPVRGPTVVISGSCSQMTNAQVAAYRAEAPAIAVDVDRAITGDAVAHADELAQWVLSHQGGLAPLVYATMPPDALKAVQARHGAARASEAIEHLFALLARRLEAGGIVRFIVAGGETSGSVTQALGIPGFAIGLQIAPGVPWVRAVGKQLALALKSGNFGGERFFFDAQSVTEGSK